MNCFTEGSGYESQNNKHENNNMDFPVLLSYDAQYDRITTCGFPMWDIETALKRFIKAKRVVVIAGACHY